MSNIAADCSPSILETMAVVEKAEIDSFIARIIDEPQFTTLNDSAFHKFIETKLRYLKSKFQGAGLAGKIDELVRNLRPKKSHRLPEKFDPETYESFQTAHRFVFGKDAVAGASIENPYYEQQKQLLRQLSQTPFEDFGRPPRATAELLTKDYSKTTLVLIYEDDHWHRRPIEEVRKLVSTPSIDWVAIEMIPASYQKEIDIYIQSPNEADPAFKAAEKNLKDYFAAIPDQYFLKGT